MYLPVIACVTIFVISLAKTTSNARLNGKVSQCILPIDECEMNNLGVYGEQRLELLGSTSGQLDSPPRLYISPVITFELMPWYPLD